VARANPTIDMHPDKKKLIDMLLAGVSCREVAKVAGISHTAVANYKRKVIKPALRTAAKLREVNELQRDSVEAARETGELTRAVIAADPFISRVSRQYEHLDKAYQLAEDKEDPRAIAAVATADSRVTELHARLDGRLDAQPTGANCAVIVLPVAGLPPGMMPAQPAAPRQLGPGEVEFLPPDPAATT
jgi:transcriptional regulator with XRE-family HTH domain